MAAGQRGWSPSSRCTQPAYTPSAGTAKPGWTGTFAVGKPSSRPRWSPRTTTPVNRNTWSLSSRTRPKSPSSTAWRTNVSGGPEAEPEVLPDDDPSRVQRPENTVDEFRRAPARHLGGELDHDDL